MQNNVYNPACTYRIQFHKNFTLGDLEKFIPYFKKLGVQTIYASPVFKAVPGSTHGYNGLNPLEINPEIGTLDQLKKVITTLKKTGIGWLQDIVPNHMAFDTSNAWLADVLEKGQASSYASYFDVDWNHEEYKGVLAGPSSPAINYRRFFTINDLICLNMQDIHVFDHYHQLIKSITRQEYFQGLRIDHIDGLYDPETYLQRLRELTGSSSYLVVEKILQPGETLPGEWKTQGTTGYDFLGLVNQLFTNKEAENEFTRFYEQLTGDSRDIHKQLFEKKALILYNDMQGELNHLYNLLINLVDKKLLSAIPSGDLKKAIAEFLIHCPVYRFYKKNNEQIENILKEAEHNAGLNTDAVNFLRSFLFGNQEESSYFFTRCMQFTGPLMAKGLEDTLMYTFNRFIANNEVGDSPEIFGISKDQFHNAMVERHKNWPLTMNATATHDTKRGEDARARLTVLSDIPQEWFSKVREWRSQNNVLSPSEEYFIYQTLIGHYSQNDEDFKNRIAGYLQKMLREAKINSNWIKPNEEYEKRAIDFVFSLLDENGPFLQNFLPFHKEVSEFGTINSLVQLVLKFTCPGVPDIYQGCECWDFSFVDPDNRRPVDYNVRNESLTKSLKTKLTQTLCDLRAGNKEFFRAAEYIPLQGTGIYSEYVLAFARKQGQRSLIVVVPIHAAMLCNRIQAQNLAAVDWKDTNIILPDCVTGNAENLLFPGKLQAGRNIYIHGLFANFPAALFFTN